MIDLDLALRSLDAAFASRDAWLITIGLITGVLLWQVEEQLGRRLRDRGGRRER